MFTEASSTPEEQPAQDLTPVFSLNEFLSGPQLPSSLGDGFKTEFSSPSCEAPDLTLGETHGVPVPSRMVFRIWKDRGLVPVRPPHSLGACNVPSAVPTASGDASTPIVSTRGRGWRLRAWGWPATVGTWCQIVRPSCWLSFIYAETFGWAVSQDFPCPPLSLSAHLNLLCSENIAGCPE